MSGGPEKAVTGELSIMVGGSKHIFESSLSILQSIGNKIFYMGGPGFGQATKLVNQILVSLNVVASCEALNFAASQGLDMKLVKEVIEASAGDSSMFRRIASQIVSKSYTSGFQTYLLHKDLGLALNARPKDNVPLVMSSLSRELFGANLKLGNASLNSASLINVLERLSGRDVRD